MTWICSEADSGCLVRRSLWFEDLWTHRLLLVVKPFHCRDCVTLLVFFCLPLCQGSDTDDTWRDWWLNMHNQRTVYCFLFTQPADRLVLHKVHIFRLYLCSQGLKKKNTLQIHGEDLERFDILHNSVIRKIEVRKTEQMLSGRCKYIASGLYKDNRLPVISSSSFSILFIYFFGCLF